MVLFFVFLVSVSISIALIPILIRYSGVLHMMDQPDERKVHTMVIPRCGGLGLATGAIAALLLYLPAEHEILTLLLGSVVIVFFGFLDDRFELNYKWKFLGQFVATFIVLYGGIHFFYLPFFGLDPAPLVLTLPLTVIFVIGVTNAVNLSDGLDGLAAGIMLMTLATIAFLAMDTSDAIVAMIALAVAGGIVGFLWFNTHPAIVFMGDSGSQFIGFIAVFLSIYLTQVVNPALNPALPLLLLGLPVLDTLSVMTRRLRAGRSPFSPDKTHIHHRLLNLGFSHAEAVASIYLMQGIYLAAALYFRYSSDLTVVGSYLIISSLVLLFFFWASKTKWNLHPAKQGENRRGNRLWRSNKLFQFCRHYINLALSFFLLTLLLSISDLIISFSNDVFLMIICGMLLFIMLPKLAQDLWVRFSIYNAAIFTTVMELQFPEMGIYSHWSMDVFLFFLIIVVSVAIRITRKTKFRVTTQDLLVILFAVSSIFLVDTEFIGHVIFRLFCVVYALEYLLHRNYYKFRLTRYLSALTGILILAVIWPYLSH